MAKKQWSPYVVIIKFKSTRLYEVLYDDKDLAMMLAREFWEREDVLDVSLFQKRKMFKGYKEIGFLFY